MQIVYFLQTTYSWGQSQFFGNYSQNSNIYKSVNYIYSIFTYEVASSKTVLKSMISTMGHPMAFGKSNQILDKLIANEDEFNSNQL